VGELLTDEVETGAARQMVVSLRTTGSGSSQPGMSRRGRLSIVSLGLIGSIVQPLHLIRLWNLASARLTAMRLRASPDGVLKIGKRGGTNNFSIKGNRGLGQTSAFL